MAIVLLDSYAETNQSANGVLNNTYKAWCQSFECNLTGMYIDNVKFYLKKTNSPTGNAVAKLYAHSGTWGSSGVPGDLLGTSDTYDVTGLSTSYGLITFNFSGAQRAVLSSGTRYCIVIEYTSGDATNTISVGYDSSSSSHPGSSARYTTSWTTYSNYDVCFYAYGDDTAPRTGDVRATQVVLEVLRSIAVASSGYDDGTPEGGIVFGGAVVEVGTAIYTDGTSSGGIVFGGESTPETEPDENHQVDGTASGGIVFGGEVAEQWTAVPNTLVAVKGGTYRIGGTIYTLAESLTYTGLGSIAAIVNCGDPPAAAGQYRYDLLSIDAAGTITVTAGTASTTPVMPTLPVNEVRLDHVLRYYGQVTIIQADIGKIWTAPVLTTLTATVDDDELAWAETDTDIDIVCRDQYGQLYTGGKVINTAITTGNGTLTPASRSGSASTMTFNYTRDGEVTDVSPVLTFTSSTGPFVTVFVRLLDDSGDLMV